MFIRGHKLKVIYLWCPFTPFSKLLWKLWKALESLNFYVFWLWEFKERVIVNYRKSYHWLYMDSKSTQSLMAWVYYFHSKEDIVVDSIAPFLRVSNACLDFSSINSRCYMHLPFHCAEPFVMIWFNLKFNKKIINKVWWRHSHITINIWCMGL